MTKTKFTNAAIIIGVLLLLVLPACAVAPFIISTTPDNGLNNTNPLTVSIAGSNFADQLNTTVYLNQTGQSDLVALNFNRVSDILILANFDLTGAHFGPWNVIVGNSSDSSVGIGVDNLTVYNNPPTLSGISPDTGMNNSASVPFTLYGTWFFPTPSINLTGSFPNITGTILTQSSTTITGTFNLSGAEAGLRDVEFTNPDGQFASIPDGYNVTNPAPIISSVTTVSQAYNNFVGPFAVGVHGLYFQNPGATVAFTKSGQTDIIQIGSPAISSNQIDVMLNILGIGGGWWNVTVTNPDGQYVTYTNGLLVLYPNAPSISTISPGVGDNNGNQDVTITGNNFVNTTVILNKAASNITATINSVSTTSINATLPLNGAATGQWNVIVTNDDGQSAILPNGFTIKYPTPVVSSITPDSGTNTGIINITDLHGSGFMTGATVKLSRSGQADIPGTSVIVDSQNRILCLFDLTGKLAGPWNVTVTNTDLQSGTLQNGFTITQPAPTVISITPNTGVNNGSVSITDLSGTGFVAGATVRLNKTGYDITNSTPVVVVNPGKITTTFNLAGAPTGQWNVIVTNLDSQSATLTNGFTINNAAPDITGIDPATGLNNGPVGIFNLSGHNFQTGATVRLYKGVLSPIAGTSVNVIPPSKITCFFDLTGIPVGAYNVGVTNPDTQDAVLENGFHVFYPQLPAITGITPDNGINIGPVSTIITGSEFHSGLTANLTLGSDSISGTVSGITSGSFASDFNITGAATGTWDLKVTNDDGQFAIKTGAFTVTAPVPPGGNVTADPVSGTAPLDVQFNLTPTGTPPFTYLWTFGDSGNSTDKNPLHSYAVANTYYPTVSITNAAGNVTVASPAIIVNAPVEPPVASFTTSTSTGDAPLEVQFNDTSIGTPPFTYLWNFGDGAGTSTAQNPDYIYTVPGVYTANLTVNNSAGMSTANTTITVNTPPIPPVPPVADFTASPDKGFVPLTVTFTDASETGILSWNWDFGDGLSSTLQNPPPHLYSSAQNFTVNLEVTNASGTNSTMKNIIVTDKPVSNFTATPTEGIRPLTVNFTDLSTDATGWYWDFGDGTNSTGQNPQHIYVNEGTYSVSLTAQNAGGNGDTVVKINYISARIPGPVASFTANPTHGDVPLLVQFNDTSINNPTSWNWDFGDYTSSIQQNPSHTYTTPGLKTVRLEASNSGGSNTSVMPNLINATQPKPEADFTGYPASGIAGETEFHFIDLSTNDPTSWHWNFGDGHTSDTRNTTHTYQTHGNYYVSLTATNAGGSDTETKGPIVVKNPRAIANFTGTPTLGSVPLTVQFNDTSSNFPNTWAWDFGDNTFARDIRNPVHTYNKAGSYTVTLAVNDTTAGQPASVLTRSAYITVVNTPIAEFTASPTSGTAPLFVRFTDQSQGNPIRFYWRFGDGTTSNVRNPTHYYKSPGVYTVTETVQNLAGFNTTVKQDLITVTELPQAAFFVNATSGTAPTTIRFTDSSTGVPNSWSWDFGDGSPHSTEQNPVHTYYSSGVYSVQLIVSNGIGSSTATKPSLIRIGTPTGADFTFKPAEGDVPLMLQFTDNSAGSPILIYKWQFGDGYVSKEQNPVHTYLKPGNYTVTLTIITNTGATSSVSKEVVLTGTPVASFKANPTGGSSPLTVQFTDTSSNVPTTWFWTFGDGTYGNVRNPVHTYNSAGTYTVRLFVSNSYGDDTVTYPGLISVSPFP